VNGISLAARTPERFVLARLLPCLSQDSLSPSSATILPFKLAATPVAAMAILPLLAESTMCGIVGILIKDPARRSQLGEFVTPMLVCLDERGPDSAGLAAFEEHASSDARRISLFCAAPDFDWASLGQRICNELDAGARLSPQAASAELVSSVPVEKLRAWIARHAPQVQPLAVGKSIRVIKDEGRPGDIARRYLFETLAGTHAIGHTRMATESAVSPLHAHPFTAGEDFCLVHNGSLSNHHMIRRKLERKGIRFETDNDSEAACRYLQWRMQEGDALETAIEAAFRELDGFYTLLIATLDSLVVVRDPFACKPAVAAETDAYVAVASEYRSLAHLPGIEQAELFEPAPERIYAWNV
jgi:glutamate synthase domain-containing protein 1